MNYNKYCKRCGSIAKPFYHDNGSLITYTCTCKATPLDDNEYIVGYRLDARLKQLKAMHELMCYANDEEIYMEWISVMPDCPTEDDFFSIACDDEQYNECFDLFVRLIANNDNRY